MRAIDVAAKGVSVYLAELEEDVELAALDADEQARAARFVQASDGRRFVTARATLRRLIAEYTGTTPDVARFALNAYGKPRLAYPTSNIEFNVSHSGGLALFALTFGLRVGIDIELVRALPNLEAIAARFFAVPEREAIARLPQAERVAAFYRCWTRKEAYIKAIGTGLSTPLADFAVSVSTERATLEWHASDADELRRWHMEDVAVPDGFAAALVVEVT